MKEQNKPKASRREEIIKKEEKSVKMKTDKQ